MPPPEPRRFDFSLSERYAAALKTHALVYRHLIERVGIDAANASWEALPSDPDPLTREILALDARPEPEESSEAGLMEPVREVFSAPVRGITAENATRFLRSKPPFSFIDAAVPAIQGVFAVTTVQYLHLFKDALARVAEGAVSAYGRAGGLMIYDALLSDWDSVDPISADEFMRTRLERYRNPPETPDIFSAGLDIELVRGDRREILAHVTDCAWATHFREHHPSVGYLLACSQDDPIYRLQCQGVRFQRRCTLMEGGPYCEFFFYRTDGAA